MERIATHEAHVTVAESSGPTRERLLDVAERLFAERGFAATSVRGITAEAGCNLAAVNYHFGGKDQLYEEVFRRRLGAMREQRLGSIRRILSEGGEGSLEGLLRAFATAFLEPFLAASDGRLWSTLMSRELLEPHLPSGMFVQEIITPVHEELAAALIPACPGLDGETARRCTHSLVGQLVQFMRVERCFDDADDADDANDADDAPDERAGQLPLPELIDHVVLFSAAGIRATAAGRKPRREGEG